jgi:hypothetical protein
MEWFHFMAAVGRNTIHILSAEVDSSQQNTTNSMKQFTQPRNSPLFMEHIGSIPCSQHPIIGPYPELDESNPYLPNQFP